MTISLHIVDDEELVRTGLRTILTAEPDMEVLGESADGAGSPRWPRSSGRTWC